MPETRLKCRNAASAAAVVAAGAEPGDPQHTVRQDGRHVVIGYVDKWWPWTSPNGRRSKGMPATKPWRGS